MKSFLTTLPLPICGLILALVSLGNLLKQEGLFWLGQLTGICGLLLLVLMLLKVCFAFTSVRTALRDPITASVAPTFSMAVMTSSTYFVATPLAGFFKYFWLGGFVVHLGLLIYFTYAFVIKEHLSVDNIYPSWYIVYIGLGIVPITDGAFFPKIGTAIFYPVLLFYVFMIPVVFWRVFFGSKIQEARLPLVAIISAPTSLCLTGYLKAFAHPNWLLLVVLLVFAQLCYAGIIVFLIAICKLPFYPSYSAFTFPLVISATAFSLANHLLQKNQHAYLILTVVERMEVLAAVLIVFYVLVRYLNYLYRLNAVFAADAN